MQQGPTDDYDLENLASEDQDFDEGQTGEEENDRSGAYDFDRLVEDESEVPQEYQNPAGAGRGECDDEIAEKDESCDLEVTALTEDQVLEETMPGIGIDGFEGEEVGGG